MQLAHNMASIIHSRDRLEQPAGFTGIRTKSKIPLTATGKGLFYRPLAQASQETQRTQREAQ